MSGHALPECYSLLGALPVSPAVTPGQARHLIGENVAEDPKLKDRCTLLDTIPGIGLQTAAIVVSELGSPERFESARQAAAYAGLVPRHRESGTSVRANPRMSKVGNGRLRRAMYFSSMTALRFNSAVKAFGERLKERGKEKMVVLGAAMRKLLHICYGVLKSGRPYHRCILGPDTLNTHHRICLWSGATKPSLNIYPLPELILPRAWRRRVLAVGGESS